MVEPSKRTNNLFGLYNGDFVRDGVTPDNADGISEHLVAIFDGLVLDVDGIT